VSYDGKIESSDENKFYIIISGFMSFPAGDLNILARNIFEMWAKSKKIAIFRYPLHTESRSNGANLWLVMRVHTGHHHDPIGYGLVHTRLTDRWMDGWMDGWTDATRTILKTVLPLGFELTIICLMTFHAQSRRGNLKLMKFSNSVKLCQAKKILYHIWFHEEVSCRRFQYSSSKHFWDMGKKGKKNCNLLIPHGTLKVGQMAPIFCLWWVHTGHPHDPIGYGQGLMVTKRAHHVDGWTPLSFQLSKKLKNLWSRHGINFSMA
jgi:hypothetical protein